MKKIIDRQKKTRMLQQNLSAIRRIAGWTTEDLGERIGVSKQTISNLENNKTPLSFTQYIAIRAVLDCEIAENPKNEVLAKVVSLLLDHSDELDDENYEKVKISVTTVAAGAAAGMANQVLLGVLLGLLPSIRMLSYGAEGISWLESILKNKKR